MGADTNASTGGIAGFDGAAPMEIDQMRQLLQYKGKSKGKGKSKDKGPKGQQKGKQKGKDSKGKSKSDQKGSKGKGYGDGSKGKGKGSNNNRDRQCFTWGKMGRLARDCWQNQGKVRNVTNENSGQGQIHGSAQESTVSGFSSASQQQSSSQAPSSSQAAQYRVSQIREAGEDVFKHDELVFDMRGSSPCSSPTSSHGVRVVRHFIGDCDECDDLFTGTIRTIVNDVGDDSYDAMFNILLDTNADASIFPSSLLGLGQQAHGVVGKVCDAQGVEIPVEAVQDMEIRLQDISGKTVILKERVAVSDRVSQPILSFGNLLQEGWTIDGSQQALTHRFGAHVPVSLQNTSLIVQGQIRVIHENVPGVTFKVCAIQATVQESLLNGRVGWELDEVGCGVGEHFSDKCQDPSLVKPGLPGRLCRTTLVEGDDKKWYIVELCERLDSFNI